MEGGPRTSYSTTRRYLRTSTTHAHMQNDGANRETIVWRHRLLLWRTIGSNNR